jgi:chitin disaccharide deacetylase
MRRLIVNADDFGLTRGVSEGILAAHRHGIVTSTTVLVTAPISRDLLDRLDASGLGAGVHLNLTLGSPITRSRSLVDNDGRFVRDARHAAARANAGDVEKEVEAQIERFESLLKRSPTHLDTHHHVGLHAPVKEIVLRIAGLHALPVRSQDAVARAAARSAGLATPDHFFGESGPGPYWTLSRTLSHLRRLPPGSSEFMTHPGYCDDALSYSRFGRQRETELAALGSPAARAAVAALGIRLCDFRDLAMS